MKYIARISLSIFIVTFVYTVIRGGISTDPLINFIYVFSGMGLIFYSLMLEYLFRELPIKIRRPEGLLGKVKDGYIENEN